MKSNIISQFRIPIRIKLMTIVSTLVLASLGFLTYISLSIFEDDMTSVLKELNSRTNKLLADKVSSEIEKKIESLNLINRLIRSNNNPTTFRHILKSFYHEDSDTILSLVYRIRGQVKESLSEKPEYALYNPESIAKANLSLDLIMKKLVDHQELLLRTAKGELLVKNISDSLGQPAWMLTVPIFDEMVTANPPLFNVMITIIKSDGLASLFEADTGGLANDKKSRMYTSFLVGENGEVIIHPDLGDTLRAKTFSNHPVVERMLNSKTKGGMFQYTLDGTNKFGSYTKLSIGNLAIISTVEADRALEGVHIARIRSILISLLIISLAILFIYYFSKTLSEPIKTLVQATKEIHHGNFKQKLVAKTRDEIGELTESFNKMSDGLEEREKLKGAFGKFVNPKIAEKIMKGDLALGGERINATIFFSDIRSFTAISETMDPEQVVEFLNEYMTLMVKIIHDTQGIVDKFIGDAIMAVWGIPEPGKNDTINAIDAALQMRYQLLEFNKQRQAANKPVIRMGCGINTGVVLAGQIGSIDRLEYTVIGDTVNLASRIESLTKPFGTDILISENTHAIVKDHFLVQPMQKIMVKGKSKPQQVFTVLGRKDNPNCPANLEEVRILLGMQGGNPAKATPDKIFTGAEKKYETIKK